MTPTKYFGIPYVVLCTLYTALLLCTSSLVMEQEFVIRLLELLWKNGFMASFFSISVKFGETLQKCWLENEKKPKYPNLSLNIITMLDHHFNILVLSPSSVDSSRTLNIMRKC